MSDQPLQIAPAAQITPAAKRAATLFTEALNSQLAKNPAVGRVLADDSHGLRGIDVLNGILSEIAPGASVLEVRHPSGELVDYVMRTNVVKPAAAAPADSSVPTFTPPVDPPECGMPHEEGGDADASLPETSGDPE